METKASVRPEARDPFVGREIGGFLIEGKIGAGGMGTVYKARQASLDRPVAFKVLPHSLVGQEQFLDRFFREARSTARLVHTNVVQVYDAGEEDGTYYIAMEFVRGLSLDEVIKQQGRLPLRQSLAILMSAAKGLRAASGEGIVHRDIKPGNVMISDKGTVKIMDFGLAREVSADEKITVSGQILGTPAYMSPEQCDGQEADSRSDIYSLGIVSYRMITGVLPFGGSSVFEIITKHLTAPLPDPRELDPDIPSSVAGLLQRMTEKKPEDRFRDFDDLLEETKKALHSLGTDREVRAELSTMIRSLDIPEVVASVRTPISRRLQKHKKALRTIGVVSGALTLALAGAILALVIAGRSGGAGPPDPGTPSGARDASAEALAKASTAEEEAGREEALAAYRKVMETWPGTPAALKAREAVARLDRERREARARSARLIFQKAVDALEGEDFETSSRLLREVMKAYPETEYFGKAESLLGRLAREQETFRRQAEALPKEIEKALSSRDLEKARSLMEKAIRLGVMKEQLEPFESRIGKEEKYAGRMDSGERAFEAGRFSEAFSSFEQAAQIFPRPEALKARDRAGARRAIRLAREATEAGDLEAARGHVEAARRLFRSAGIVEDGALGEVEERMRSGAFRGALSDLKGDYLAHERRGENEAALRLLTAFAERWGSDAPWVREAMRRVRGIPEGIAFVGTGEKGRFTYRNGKDGSLLVLVPAGEVVVGADDAGREAAPPHRVRLSAFLCGVHEVSNSRFATFLNDVGRDADAEGRPYVEDSSRYQGGRFSWGVRKSEGRWKPVSGYENHPVILVSWFGAAAYAKWAGLELPTEARWEYAARGPEPSAFPWGNRAPSGDLLNGGKRYLETLPVDALPGGKSPFGGSHFAGNVAEWCRDWYASDFYRDPSSSREDPENIEPSGERSLRGGSWIHGDAGCRSSERAAGFNPAAMSPAVGFRCVKSIRR